MSSRSLLAGVALGATALLTVAVPAAQAQAAAAPATVAKKVFKGFVKKDRKAMLKWAAPDVVDKLLAYKFRDPDKFAGCTAAGTCRFVHTSVKVPGDLNGFLMVVKNSRVTTVYTSQHVTSPTTVAKTFYRYWQLGAEEPRPRDRHRRGHQDPLRRQVRPDRRALPLAGLLQGAQGLQLRLLLRGRRHVPARARHQGGRLLRQLRQLYSRLEPQFVGRPQENGSAQMRLT